GLPAPYYPDVLNVYVAVIAAGAPPPTTSFDFTAAIPVADWGVPYTLSTNPSSSQHPPVTNGARVTKGYIPNPTISPAIQFLNYFSVTEIISGKPPAGQDLLIGSPVPYPIIIPGNMAGSSGSVGTNPSSSVGFGIGTTSGINIGEMGINSAGVFTFTTPGGNPVFVPANSQLKAFTPNPQDPNLQNVSFTIVGNATGAFPAGRDVYVLCTFVGAGGETAAGPPSSVINTAANDAVLVTVPTPSTNFVVSTVGIYEADVPTGSPPPTPAQFAQVSYQLPNATVVITASVTGPAPPVTNQSGTAGDIANDTVDGGLNGTQGYRYGCVSFINNNYSNSGFTQAAVVKTIIDYDGYQLGCFNIPPGPANIIGRELVFTEADGTSAGPFFGIGNLSNNPATNFVYPQTTISDGVVESATILYNTTQPSATVNFSDPYLISATDLTDRLRVIWPYSAVDIYYSPTLDRMIQTGVPGFNGHWISLEQDPESYYKDSGFVPTSSASGEKAICVRDFRGQAYSLRERSGFLLSLAGVDELGNANWEATQRWDKVGPCGPRAVDVCGQFMVFVHRSGIYRYHQGAPEPEFVGKEIPNWWQTINWKAAQFIQVAIDEEMQCVRIQVPVGNSMVPNQEVLLYYKEGWNTPIHFSTYSGREISMDSARRYAINDVAAFIGVRIERQLPLPPGGFQLGDEGIPELGPAFYTSQFLYASSGPDGNVAAITPGVFHDSGPGGDAVGIDWRYEGMSSGTLYMNSKCEGGNCNARGNGQIFPYLLAARDMVSDWHPA